MVFCGPSALKNADGGRVVLFFNEPGISYSPCLLAFLRRSAVFQDFNAGWRCAALGTLSSVVLPSLQTPAGDWGAQSQICGLLRVQGGQQQRHRPQPVFVGGVKKAKLSKILYSKASSTCTPRKQ